MPGDELGIHTGKNASSVRRSVLGRRVALAASLQPNSAQALMRCLELIEA
jgi:hypothetical protein